MKIIAVANQKGGIGKTTTAMALATGLHRLGKKVVLVDMDPQCNATDTYRAEIEGVGTIYDLLVEGDTDCIQTTKLGDIIAGDPQLTEASEMLTGVSAAHKLRKGLKDIAAKYDYVILDTPPALGILLTNSLTAADTVVIPLTADRYGLQGLLQLYKTVSEIREYTNPALGVAGFLLVKHRDNTLSKAVAESLPKYAAMFETRIFETKIRESIAARKAQALQEGLFDFDPHSTTAQDYEAFISELLEVAK